MKKFILIIALLSFGLIAGQIKLRNEHAIDPVYNLPLKNYKKFICEATLKNGKVIQFVSVKSMMQVFYHQGYFIDHKYIDSNIKNMYVQDFLTGEKLDAKKALYVFGSRIIGPHGDDLVPLKDEASVKIFAIKYKGTKTLPYKKITVGLIKYLDM